jgi:hypothetical protein
VKRGFASIEFIDLFMKSTCAADLDMEFNRLQWLGEEYIMEELIDEVGDKLVPGRQYSEDAMFWAGYIYRYWHFLTGESSKEISKQASGEKMIRVYPAYHTFANMDLAVELLKEDAAARNKLVIKKKISHEKGEMALAPSAAKTVKKR